MQRVGGDETARRSIENRLAFFMATDAARGMRNRCENRSILALPPGEGGVRGRWRQGEPMRRRLCPTPMCKPL
jgi:hypothetical protein